MSELKPCPFCGGKPRMINWGWPTISCSNCDLVMHGDDDYKTTEIVIDMWNRRVDVVTARMVEE